MADIFEIVGKFAIDGADKAKKEINDVTNTGEKSSSKLNKIMGGMGKLASTAGKAVGAGLLAGGTAIVALGKQAVSAYGEYEQLVGGVETLFKESADKVIENSANAYKTAGMSANEYMQTVTSFSASLLQSLGGDTVKASAYADRAITDMSDNANKMGTSMEMIQNAYNGFAKQNYTMLDNLKLGYGGTKTEMERLIADASKMTDIQKELGITVDASSMSFGNIVNAISVMQKSLDITGTTAKEASSTIQGSIASMKGAWTNLLTGLSDDTQNLDLLINNFIESVGTVGSNLLPRLEVVFKGIAKLISDLAPELVNQINAILPTVLPIVVDGAVQIVNAIAQNLPALIPMFVDMIVKIGMAIAENAPLLIDGFVQLITQLSVAIAQNLPALIPIFIDCMVQIAGAIVQNAPIIVDAILGIGSNFESGLSPAINACIGLVEVLTGAFVAFKAGAMIQSVVQGFQSAQVALSLFKLETQGASIAQGLLNGQLTIGQTVVGLLTGQVTLAEIATGLWSKAQGVLNAVMSANPIALVVMAIGAVIAIIVVLYNKCEWFRNAVNAVGNGIKTAFMAVIDWFKTLPEKISNILNTVINFIQSNWQGLLLFIVNPFAGAFKLIYDNCEGFRNFINGLGESIKTAFMAVIDWFTQLPQMIASGISAMVTFIAELPTKIAYWLGFAIGNVVKFVIDFGTKAKEAGTNFVNNLINFVKTLPGKIQTWLTNTIAKVTSFANNMVNKAKTAGTNFVNTLINFIKNLPNNVATWLTNTISKVTTFATNMVNKAKEAGTNFVNNIVNTLKSLPGNIAGFFSTVIAKITAFASQMKAKAIEAGRGFVTNILNALRALPGQVVSIGKDVVTGIWSGITSSYSWIKGKIKEWCGSLVQGFKDALDINSPSKVMSDIVGMSVGEGIAMGIGKSYNNVKKQVGTFCNNMINGFKKTLGINSPARITRDDVGKPLVEGIAVGIKENSGEVSKEFQKMLDDLQLQRDLDLINEDEYYSQLEVLRNKYLEKGSKDWWQYTKEIIDYEKNSLNSLKDLNEEITNEYKNHLKERETLTSEFYSKISANKLYDNPSLIFEGEKKSWYELNDWTDELKTLDEFENKILSVQERLKNVFAGDDEILQSVLDTIRNDAFSDESSILLNVMNNTDDASLRKWAEGYKQYIEKSKRITKNVYEDDIKSLDNNFLQKISEKFANSPLFEQLKSIGENVTESLMDGIESKSDWLKEQILNFCNSISQTFGDAFSVGGIDNVQLAGTTGINSIRNYQIDYTVQLNNINDSIDRFISLVGEYLPGISQKMDRPIVVDGNSLAVGMARKMDSQLGKLTVAKGRGNV